MIFLVPFILLTLSYEIKLASKEKRKRKKIYPTFYLCFGGLITYAKNAEPTDIDPITINNIK